jgi:hypothetical protein
MMSVPDIWYMYMAGPDNNGTEIWKCIRNRVFRVAPSKKYKKRNEDDGVKGELRTSFHFPFSSFMFPPILIFTLFYL